MRAHNFPKEMFPVVVKAIREKKVEWLPGSTGFAQAYTDYFNWGGFKFRLDSCDSDITAIALISGEPNEEYLFEYMKVVPKKG